MARLSSMLKQASAITACLLVMGSGAVTASSKAPESAAQSAMCMAAGERVSGMNKICFYDCLGSTQTLNRSSVALCPLSINAPMPGTSRTPQQSPVPRGGQVTCFARGEEMSGMNKVCYYDCLGSARAVTQSAVSLCPLTINQ